VSVQGGSKAGGVPQNKTRQITVPEYSRKNVRIRGGGAQFTRSSERVWLSSLHPTRQKIRELNIIDRKGKYVRFASRAEN